MTQFNQTVNNNFTTDAQWRTWCQQFESCLLASGFLIAATDTGQIDLTTAVRPAIGAFAGYKIYKGNDSLQATKPLFIKVEYGVGTATNRPKVQITIGTGSNGSGTLTGLTSTVQSVVTASADGSGAGLIFGGGHASCAWVAVYDGAISTQGGFFCIGRIIDIVNGNASNQASYFSAVSGSSGSMFGTASWTDGTVAWTAITNGAQSVFPDLAMTLQTGGDVNTILLYQGIIYRNAKTYTFPLLGGRTSELPFTDPVSSSFSLTIWGGNHSFVPMPWGSAIGGSNGRIAMLWDS